MPLLNIGKKKGGAVEAATEAVPDELPDLPAETAQDQPQPAEGAPADLPPAELAPDELPPMTPDGLGLPGQEMGMPGTGDRKLYFSSLLQKLHEEGIKSTKLTTGNINVLADMKKHWKKTKKEEELEDMEKQLAEKLSPLQRLEQEWVSLRDEIDMKRQLMREKEEEIRQLSEELKSFAIKTEKMGSKK